MSFIVTHRFVSESNKDQVEVYEAEINFSYKNIVCPDYNRVYVEAFHPSERLLKPNKWFGLATISSFFKEGKDTIRCSFYL